METLKYWTNDGIKYEDGYHNYISEITGEVELVKSHMGGNYGPGDEYIVTNKDGKFKVLYYGDSSAQITKL